MLISYFQVEPILSTLIYLNYQWLIWASMHAFPTCKRNRFSITESTEFVTTEETFHTLLTFPPQTRYPFCIVKSEDPKIESLAWTLRQGIPRKRRRRKGRIKTTMWSSPSTLSRRQFPAAHLTAQRASGRHFLRRLREGATAERSCWRTRTSSEGETRRRAKYFPQRVKGWPKARCVSIE